MPQEHAVLEQKFESLRNTNPREAAEYAYALARLYQRDGNNEKAIQYGRESIALFEMCKTGETWESCAPININIGGVTMPSSFIHDAVVRDRLQPLVL